MVSQLALLDFQKRLVTRIESAQADADAGADWLAVRAGGRQLLIPLSHAGEIQALHEIERVPYVKPWFMGVANLRGTLCAVIDLGAFLAGSAVPARTAAELARCQVISLNPRLDPACALLVDEVNGMRTVADFVRSDPVPEGDGLCWGHLYTAADGQRWQEIDLQGLSELPAFLDVGA